MTEAQLIHIEQIARVHWWHRNRDDKLQADICLGAGDPAAQLAAETVDGMWSKVRDTETQAMRMALQGITLVDLIG